MATQSFQLFESRPGTYSFTGRALVMGHDDLDLPVVLTHLAVIVEVDVSDHVAPVRMVLTDAAHELADQRRPTLLEQLVVDGLIEVAEHVHVAPPQLDTEAVLESRHRDRGV